MQVNIYYARMLWVLECDLSKTKRKFVTLVVPRILGKKKLRL